MNGLRKVSLVLLIFAVAVLSFFPMLQLSYSTPISRIQYMRGTNSGATITVTLTSTPTNGNDLIAVISNEGSGQTVNGISETGVTQWAKVVSGKSGNNQAEVEIWKAENVQGASKTIIITLSGTPAYGGSADVLEYSGLATSSSTDQTANTSGAGTSSVTGTTPTTTNANELRLGGISSYGTATSGPTNGFTLIDGSSTGTTGITSVLEKIVSSTGTASSGVSSGGNWWAGTIATFEAASSTTTTSSTSTSSTTTTSTTSSTTTGPSTNSFNVHAGATQVIVTVLWTGTGTASVQISGPGGTPTLSESGAVIYDQISYISSSSTPTNIHRVTFTLNPSPASAQTWTAIVTSSASYTVTIEVS
ncbi:MAG TPA: hypothetical protein VE862_08610 [Candidatus Acidoferrum sp.]|nr:hypothetical protein [Candidatus Acidoferrum sp.]